MRSRRTLEYGDGAALGLHRAEENVEDLIECLGEGLVGQKCRGRSGENGEDAVLADKIFGAARRLEDALLKGLDREDLRAHGLDVVFGVFFAEVPLNGDRVIPQLDLITLAKRRRPLNARSVHQRAVLAAQVGDHQAPMVEKDLGVHSREPLVGNEDVRVARTTEGRTLPLHLDSPLPFRRPEEQFGRGHEGPF